MTKRLTLKQAEKLSDGIGRAMFNTPAVTKTRLCNLCGLLHSDIGDCGNPFPLRIARDDKDEE